MQKHIFLALFLVFITAATLSAQTTASPRTEQEIKSLLCHKWQIRILNVAGEDLPMEPGDEKSFVTYFKDGTFLVESQDGNEKDKWIYNHKNKSIKSSDVVKKIEFIDEKKLVLSITTDGLVTKMTLARVD